MFLQNPCRAESDPGKVKSRPGFRQDQENSGRFISCDELYDSSAELEGPEKDW